LTHKRDTLYTGSTGNESNTINNTKEKNSKQTNQDFAETMRDYVSGDASRSSINHQFHKKKSDDHES
jgi:hypothetical protein